jgi:hypothetical protein
MGGAKSGGQEVRVGEVFVECAEKEGFPGFGFFRQGDNCTLRGRRRLPEEKTQLAGSKEGGWGHTDRHLGSKMEIPDNVLDSGGGGVYSALRSDGVSFSLDVVHTCVTL